MTDVFTVDTDQAERYGSYVRQGRYEPYRDHDQRAELAWYAWERATAPVMVPPYVERSRHLLGVSLSTPQGALTARLDVVLPQPENLRRLHSEPARSGGIWRDWLRQSDVFGAWFYEPEGDELERDPYLLCTASLRFAVPLAGLPHPSPYGADAETCKQAIAVLVPVLNAVAGPVMDRIEGN